MLYALNVYILNCICLYTLSGTKKLRDVICAQNWKPVEVGHNISNSEKVTESQF